MLLYKRHWKKWRHYCSSSAYRLVCNSGLFDAVFYCTRYPDVPPQHTDPLNHYLDTGWTEGRNTNSLFDTAWYRETYPQTGDEPPLLHYLRTGCREGCNPTPLFFTIFYLGRYRNLIPAGQTPLAHYLRNWRQGLDPNPLFDGAWYLRRHPELLTSGIDPLADFIHGGNRRLQSTHPLFDMDYYLAANPFVREDWLFPVLHFLCHGGEPPEFGSEPCYRPNPYLDLDFYRREYLDDRGTALEAFEHYATEGVARDLRPDPLFDPSFYRETYDSNFAPHESPLAHYLRTGRRTGCLPCPELANLRRRPVISIVTPVYNTEPHQLRRCVLSVVHQPYPDWELWLVDDGSSAGHVRPLMEELGALDDRIRLRFEANNQGISAATNAGAAAADGEYLAFLDHDDELSEDALFHIALAIDRENPDVLYCDEALMDFLSRPLDVFYKPRFNPELLLNHNYITHFLVTRRALFLASGGLSSEYDGAQDYDLTLKLTEGERTVVHIPRVLYYWRAHAESTSINHEQKHYADEAGRRALQAALDRRGIRGEARLTDLRFFYRDRREIVGTPMISVLISPAALAGPLPDLARRLAEQWPAFELLVAADTGVDMEPEQVRVVPPPAERGEAAWRNQAARTARGAYLCFLEGDLAADMSGWPRGLLEYAQQASIGMVGGCVRDDREAAVHRGSLPDIDDHTWRYYASFVRDVSVHHNGIHCQQNVLAVHEGFCLIGRERFIDSGGYDPTFATLAFAHLDLCCRLHAAGFANLFTPYAQAAVAAGKAGPDENDEETGRRDRRVFQHRWHRMLLAGDPYHSRQLLRDRGISLEVFDRWFAGDSADAV